MVNADDGTPLGPHSIGVVERNVARADAAAVERLARFGVATVHEALGRAGLMTSFMRPVHPGARLCGTAVTVPLQPVDNWTPHVAAEQLRPGDVAVAACTADCDDGFFGDLLATSFKARGAGGRQGRGARGQRSRQARPARRRRAGLGMYKMRKGLEKACLRSID